MKATYQSASSSRPSALPVIAKTLTAQVAASAPSDKTVSGLAPSQSAQRLWPSDSARTRALLPAAFFFSGVMLMWFMLHSG